MIENLKNKKIAFSLFEVLVTAGIVAIFIAACSNVFTKKHVKQVAIPDHGRYECYYRDGQLYSNLCNEGGACSETEETEANGCIFNAPKSANYLSINAIGSGGAGGSGSNPHGGTAGEYITSFLSNTRHPLALHPSKPGSEDPTIIRNNDNNEIILSAKSGHTTFSKRDGENKNYFNIIGCEFIQSTYSVLSFSPQCSVNKNNLTITLKYPSQDNPLAYKEGNIIKDDQYNFSEFNDTINSATDDAKKTKMIPYTVNYALVTQDDITFGSHILGEKIDYKDTPLNTSDDYEIKAEDFLVGGYGTVRLLLDDNIKPASGNAVKQESLMTLYVKSLGATEGLGGLVNSAAIPSPGDGGAKDENASTGAILISW